MRSNAPGRAAQTAPLRVRASAVQLSVLKGLFAFLTRGATAGLLSLLGSVFSVCVMFALKKTLKDKVNYYTLSVFGALFHNVGQLIGAGIIISSSLSLYYAPVMLVLGLVMGALTALILRALLPALEKLGFNIRERRPS